MTKFPEAVGFGVGVDGGEVDDVVDTETDDVVDTDPEDVVDAEAPDVVAGIGVTSEQPEILT